MQSTCPGNAKRARDENDAPGRQNSHHHAPLSTLARHCPIKPVESLPRLPTASPPKLTSVQPPKKKRRRRNRRVKGCNCKMSKCLKLYCECYQKQVFCGSDCNCNDCHNIDAPEYEDVRFSAVESSLYRNASAFFRATHAPAAGLQRKGCKCKKSQCQKNYCECYQAGLGCMDTCRCAGCENEHGVKPPRGPGLAVLQARGATLAHMQDPRNVNKRAWNYATKSKLLIPESSPTDGEAQAKEVDAMLETHTPEVGLISSSKEATCPGDPQNLYTGDMKVEEEWSPIPDGNASSDAYQLELRLQRTEKELRWLQEKQLQRLQARDQSDSGVADAAVRQLQNTDYPFAMETKANGDIAVAFVAVSPSSSSTSSTGSSWTSYSGSNPSSPPQPKYDDNRPPDLLVPYI